MSTPKRTQKQQSLTNCSQNLKIREKNHENIEIGVIETLFSEAGIFSNILYFWTKSWWWERSISVVSDVFYSVFVGRSASSQFWFDLLSRWEGNFWKLIRSTWYSIEKVEAIPVNDQLKNMNVTNWYESQYQRW